MITLPRDAQKARKKVRTGQAINTPRSSEVAYRRSLLQQLKIQRLSGSSLIRLIAGGASKQQAAQFLSSAMDASKRQFENASEDLSTVMVNGVSSQHKRRVEKMIARSFGVDWSSITDDPEVAGELELRKAKNTSLIESIGSDYWGRVSQAVEDNFAGTLDKPLIQEIARIGGVSNRQAKLIARDQTAKLASSLNEIRQRTNGISRYIWSTRKDNRVVGNPAGLYPEGNQVHGDHWSREGKEFRWDDPPHDGHPGQAINDRCTAKPVLDLDELEAQFV